MKHFLIMLLVIIAALVVYNKFVKPMLGIA